MKILFTLTIVLFTCTLLAGESLAPKPTLPVVLNRLDVAHHWLAGKHVDWLTGNPDGKPVSKSGHHTHCSAFVAAVCRDIGVPMLEPPQHPQELLADAQFDWLMSNTGLDAGWKLIACQSQPTVDHAATGDAIPSNSEVTRSATEAVQANRLTNRGKLVLAVYHSPDETQPGHNAIAIPSKRDAKSIESDGPDITQAGLENYARTTLRIGFKNHPAAWQTARDVRFFVFDQ